MSAYKYLREFMDLDLYEYNIRKRRKGHAKVNGRDDQCKIYINVNDVHLKDDEVLKAYLFKYERGNMVAVPIGTLEVKNQVGQLKVTTVRDQVMGAPYAIDDMSGLLILKKNYFTGESSRELSYGGAWDKEVKINFDVFKEYESLANEAVHNQVGKQLENADKMELKESQPSEHVNKIEEMEIVKEEVEEPEEVEIAQEDLKATKAIEMPYENKDEGEVIKEKEVVDSEKEVSEKAIEELPKKNEDSKIDTSESVEEDQEEIAPYTEPVVTKKAVTTIKGTHALKPAGYKRTMYEYERKKKGHPPLKTNIPSQKHSVTSNESKTRVETYIPAFEDFTPPEEILKKQFDEEELRVLHDKMFSEYPKMAPFEKCEDIIDCIRIEPKDIATMPINMWMLMNNTFLLNGYHKYKHLIFCRVEDDTKPDGVKYIIGVPGIYQKKDRFIAYLYGFKQFRCCANTYPKSGEYGYWTVDIGRL